MVRILCKHGDGPQGLQGEAEAQSRWYEPSPLELPAACLVQILAQLPICHTLLLAHTYAASTKLGRRD